MAKDTYRLPAFKVECDRCYKWVELWRLWDNYWRLCLKCDAHCERVGDIDMAAAGSLESGHA